MSKGKDLILIYGIENRKEETLPDKRLPCNYRQGQRQKQSR